MCFVSNLHTVLCFETVECCNMDARGRCARVASFERIPPSSLSFSASSMMNADSFSLLLIDPQIATLVQGIYTDFDEVEDAEATG